MTLIRVHLAMHLKHPMLLYGARVGFAYVCHNMWISVEVQETIIMCYTSSIHPLNAHIHLQMADRGSLSHLHPQVC